MTRQTHVAILTAMLLATAIAWGCLAEVDAGSLSGPRHSEWPAVRNAYLKEHPECAACGGSENLAVHHIVPFHNRPELELKESNFIVLCTRSRCGMNDHFIFGHNLNWKCRNPNVVRDAERFREMLNSRLCGKETAD